jgi:hypothetical protein
VIVQSRVWFLTVIKVLINCYSWSTPKIYTHG